MMRRVDDSSQHRYMETTTEGTATIIVEDMYRIPIRQILYVLILVATLIMIEQVTELDVMVHVQKHEPSIRIFRALLETVLLLVCTSASIHVWTYYLGKDITYNLLFQQVPDLWQSSKTQGEQQNHVVSHFNDDSETEEVLFEHPNSLELHESIDDGMNDKDDNIESSSDYKRQKSAGTDNNNDDEIDVTGDDDVITTEDPIVIANIPSPATVLEASLDLLVWVLVALVLYTVTAIHGIWHSENGMDDDSKNDISRIISRIAAPTFPLLLFVYVVIRAIFPWNKRWPIIKVISLTINAPWYEVTFRDGMIGDILTSTVRPLQDFAFTICYILFGLRGWWSQQYFFPEASQTERQFITTDQADFLNSDSSSSTTTGTFLEVADAGVPAMEKSWLLHTLILPACMISPLWWRFLQNMRQIYDNKQRWPFLGNAFKYFFAAQVATVGVYNPNAKSNPFWLTSFVLATLYQIWWDLFMDWGLFEKDKGVWRLRNRRFYLSTKFYYSLVVINTLLRFCWTLTFIPLRYLSAAGVLRDNFTGDTWTSILAPMIASAEIVRRTLWGFLRVEWEAIKVKGTKAVDDKVEEEEDGLELTPMDMNNSTDGLSSMQPLSLYSFSNPMSRMNNIQILGELAMYTAVFSIAALIIVAHRDTL